jgi:tetratricopeptide (TPR) repeat protein
MHRKALVASLLAALFIPVLAHAQTPVKPTDPQIKFARQFERAIATQDHDAALPMIDGAALIDTVESGIPASPAEKKDFAAAGDSFSEAMVSSLITNISKGGKFKFLRIRQRDGQTVAAFRLNNTNGSSDYLELYLKPDAHGNLRIADAYDLARGSRSTEALRRIFLGMVIKNDKNASGKLGAKERELADSITTIDSISEAVESGAFQKAIDLSKTLPESVQHDKLILYWRVLCLDQLGKSVDAEYALALADCHKYYPTDPSVDFLAIDHLIHQKQFDAAHQALDRLAAYTGEDANWDFLNGNVYLLSGQKTDEPLAIAAYRKAIAEEPDYDKPYWSLITLYLRQKDNAGVASALTALQKNAHVRIADLTKVPLYKDFVKSDEYAKWKAKQPSTTRP